MSSVSSEPAASTTGQQQEIAAEFALAAFGILQQGIFEAPRNPCDGVLEVESPEAPVAVAECDGVDTVDAPADDAESDAAPPTMPDAQPDVPVVEDVVACDGFIDSDELLSLLWGETFGFLDLDINQTLDQAHAESLGFIPPDGDATAYVQPGDVVVAREDDGPVGIIPAPSFIVLGDTTSPPAQSSPHLSSLSESLRTARHLVASFDSESDSDAASESPIDNGMETDPSMPGLISSSDSSPRHGRLADDDIAIGNLARRFRTTPFFTAMPSSMPSSSWSRFGMASSSDSLDSLNAPTLLLGGLASIPSSDPASSRRARPRNRATWGFRR